MRLAVALHERNGEPEPPQRVDRKRDGHGNGDIQRRELHDDDADDKGNAAPDISPRIALGGDVVRALVRRHVHEHGIVKDEARRIENFGENKDDEEHEPRHGNAERGAAEHARDRKEKEDGAFISRKVAQRAERRS